MPILTDFDHGMLVDLLRHPDMQGALDDFTQGMDIDFSEVTESPNLITFLVVAADRPVGFVAYWRFNSIWVDMKAGFLGLVRGKIAKDIIDCTMTHMFAFKRIFKISAVCSVDNKGARQMCGALGMNREGVIRQSIQKAGRFEDQVLFGITATEWAKIKGVIVN